MNCQDETASEYKARMRYLAERRRIYARHYREMALVAVSAADRHAYRFEAARLETQALDLDREAQ